jgi:UDP-N-acetylmuramate dehydrogenase
LRVLDSADPATGRGVLLADHTTLRIGGPAASFVTATTDAELIEIVRRADAAGRAVLVLGGGSNLVVADAGFDGLVVRVATKGLRFERAGGQLLVHAAAGERWDAVVKACLAEGLAGIEALSGIPGLVGATPIQNVGAYGTEISDVLLSLAAFDRVGRRQVRLDPLGCGFGYRTSALKGQQRFVVLGIEISLAVSSKSVPVHYGELAAALGVDVGSTAGAHDVREAVLALRASKGMLLDPADPDSVSAGSFFTNPVLDSADLPSGAPAWPAGQGRVKTSAGWLIEHAGFARGYHVGRVGLSTKHTLALVNRGGASASEVVAFARQIRDGVQARFGISLEVEPTLVGVAL